MRPCCNLRLSSLARRRLAAGAASGCHGARGGGGGAGGFGRGRAHADDTATGCAPARGPISDGGQRHGDAGTDGGELQPTAAESDAVGGAATRAAAGRGAKGCGAGGHGGAGRGTEAGRKRQGPRRAAGWRSTCTQ
eukprot:6213444-Pleurochrysis_carterae.AAC.3